MHQAFRIFGEGLARQQDRVAFVRLLARVLTTYWPHAVRPQELQYTSLYTRLQLSVAAEEGQALYQEVGTSYAAAIDWNERCSISLYESGCHA